MNFFQQLANLGQGMDIALRIKGKNGKITVAVEPQLANVSRLKPLVLTGTPEEMDEGFFAQFDGAVSSAKGLESNLSEVKKDAEDLAKNPPKTAGNGKTAGASKKPEKKVQASGKKEKEKPKKSTKPAKEEKVQPAPGDMFSQPANDSSADETETPSDETNTPAEEPVAAGDETGNETE